MEQLPINVMQLLHTVLLNIGIEVEITPPNGVPTKAPVIDVERSVDGSLTTVKFPVASYQYLAKLLIEQQIQIEAPTGDPRDGFMVLRIRTQPKPAGGIVLANEAELRGLSAPGLSNRRI